MSHFSLFNFFVRCLLQLCLYFCLQLPRAMNVRIDPIIFLSAFSMEQAEQSEQTDSSSMDVTRVNPNPWPLAPDGSGVLYWTRESTLTEELDSPALSPSQTARMEALQSWQEYRRHRSIFVPYLYRIDFNAIENVEGTGGRTRLQKKCKYLLTSIVVFVLTIFFL